jgi:hypothetical protein
LAFFEILWAPCGHQAARANPTPPCLRLIEHRCLYSQQAPSGSSDLVSSVTILQQCLHGLCRLTSPPRQHSAQERPNESERSEGSRLPKSWATLALFPYLPRGPK